MNKFYKILMLSLAAILLSIGLLSAVLLGISAKNGTDNRTDKPEFSLAALVDGSYTAKLENYFADNFLFREFLLEANRDLNQFYYFSPTGESLAIDFAGGAEQGGAQIAPNVSGDQGESPEQGQGQTALPNEEEVTSVGTILIRGNRAMDIPTALPDAIAQYGKTVGDIAAALDENVRVFSLITPNSGQFYSPESYHTSSHDQKAMIGLCYGAMGQNVRKVDAYNAIAAHTDEYLFFRTDHHWTQKGAYYAYTAFCDAAGFTPTELAQHESGQYENFVGSMYHYTSSYPQCRVLQDNPDTLIYYLPIYPTKTVYYMDASLQTAYSIPTVDTALSETVSNKYLCYICGDTPICILQSEAEGGTCLILKDSYGNAFVPFLTSHYSKVIAVDPREFGGEDEPALDLLKFVKEQEVDDLLILNYPFMMGNNSYIRDLQQLIGQ